MTKGDQSSSPSLEMVGRVTGAFLIYRPRELLEPLSSFLAGDHAWTALVKDATDGLHSVVSAATLPFHLTLDSVHERRFDRMLSAERIRNLKEGPPSAELPSDELEKRALERATERMNSLLGTHEGTTFMSDAIVYELDHRLRSREVEAAAAELLIQTLVATWAVFETFAKAFIVSWINADPRRATPVLSSPELREYFGKQVVDFGVISDHGYDLTGSMGTILFRGKRLDHLSTIRSVMEALFNDAAVRTTLGDDLWMLNQRRHLFVHKRGLVDDEYLQRTGDKVASGERLTITSDDVELYLRAVQQAIIAVASAALGGRE